MKSIKRKNIILVSISAVIIISVVVGVIYPEITNESQSPNYTPTDGKNLVEDYPDSANSSISIVQNPSESSIEKNVTVELDSLNGADYLLVEIGDNNANRFVNISNVNPVESQYGSYSKLQSTVQYESLHPNVIASVPNNAGKTPILSDAKEGAILATSGDVVTVTDIEVEEEVSIWRMKSNSTHRIARYRVGL